MATPRKAGRIPAASVASVPRRRCTLRCTNIPVEAECNQCNRPAVRNPVSSKNANGAPATRPATMRPNVSRVFAQRRIQLATVATATGAPNRSASARAVRSLDRNCPCIRYTPAAASRGPYCTGAATWAGAVARTLVPQGHLTASSRCSVTSKRSSSGRSKTWRRSVATTGASERSDPQPVQGPGR